MIMDKKEFLEKVESFMERNNVAPTTFGIKALSEPNFVFSLRKGREAREETRRKVLAFIALNDNGDDVGGDVA